MNKEVFTKILFWVEVVAIPFIFLSVWGIFTEVVTEVPEVIGIERHEEHHDEDEEKHEHGSGDFFSTERIIALALVIISILIWNRTSLHKYIPCSAHGHTINKKTLTIASILFVLHLSFDHNLVYEETLINQIAFYAHRLADIFIVLLLIINWSRIVGDIIKPALILTPLAIIFAFILKLDIHEANFGEVAHIIIITLLAFFLSSFLHKPGSHNHR